MKWICIRCGNEIIVSKRKKGNEENYICYDCEKVQEQVIKIFGKKTKRKAKRKAQQVDRPR